MDRTVLYLVAYVHKLGGTQAIIGFLGIFQRDNTAQLLTGFPRLIHLRRGINPLIGQDVFRFLLDEIVGEVDQQDLCLAFRSACDSLAVK